MRRPASAENKGWLVAQTVKDIKVLSGHDGPGLTGKGGEREASGGPHQSVSL